MTELSHVTVTYDRKGSGEPALNDFSFSFEDGRAYSIVGPSGCGKSTLLYVLAGLVEPYRGPRADVSVLLQEYGLLPWKSVWDNAAFLLRERGVSKEECETRLEAIFADLNMTAFRRRKPGSLSGGQRQRAALIRALCTRPRLLLLDEPGAALDALTRESMQELILQLFYKYPCCMISVTHDMEEACILGERILIMKKAGLSEVLDNPFFGKENLRDNAGFFAFCAHVRRCVSLVTPHGSEPA